MTEVEAIEAMIENEYAKGEEIEAEVRERLAEILDKISAEIKELTKAHCIQVMDREDIPLLALDIIEKYRGDSK